MELVLTLGFAFTFCFVMGYVFAELTRSSRLPPDLVQDGEHDDQNDEHENDVVEGQ